MAAGKRATLPGEREQLSCSSSLSRPQWHAQERKRAGADAACMIKRAGEEGEESRREAAGKDDYGQGIVTPQVGINACQWLLRNIGPFLGKQAPNDAPTAQISRINSTCFYKRNKTNSSRKFPFGKSSRDNPISRLFHTDRSHRGEEGMGLRMRMSGCNSVRMQLLRATILLPLLWQVAVAANYKCHDRWPTDGGEWLQQFFVQFGF